ncbi:MAG: AsmA-like C-terminal region-containing protein [Bacteroidales bacterium]|nr:AsmA-like C-terminal region-containing protein [Bacteroidales bacterium]MDT8372868.1 AsmA-like C-terminal region-containing protein [Bacteroidales bacterium]
MRKSIKIFLLTVASLLVLTVAAAIIIPLAIRDKIRERVETGINGMVDARVSFSNYKLSLIRSFPNAAFTLDDLLVTGIDEFSDDTLASVESFGLVFNLMSLFGDKGYEIRSVTVERPMVNAIVLENGMANWDIMKESAGEGETDASDTPEITEQAEANSLKVALNRFSIRNGRLYYTDHESGMAATVEELDLNLSGKMSGSRTVLDMDLSATEVDFEMESLSYLTDARVEFRAAVDALLDSMKFTLEDNLLKINDLVLKLEGMAAMPGDDIELDLVFSTPETSFKSLLSLVPAFYMKGYENLRASGTVALEGAARGVYSSADTTLPDISVGLQVNDGVISYPGLPEKISAISINGKVLTGGKDMDNTTVEINRFHFELAGNPFDLTLALATPVSDPEVAATAKGKIDLAKLQQAITFDSLDLNGLLDVSLEIAGRLSMIENKEYDRFRADGHLRISGLAAAMADLPDIRIGDASLIFSPARAELTGMNATIGDKSDVTLSGMLENYIPYLFSDGTLKGNLALNSEFIDLNEIMDYMPSDTVDTDTVAMEVIRIPDNLDLTFNARAGKLNYGLLSAGDVKGSIIVRDGVVTVSETGMNAMGGSLLVNAAYDTRDTLKPLVDAQMLIGAVNIREAFNTFNTVRRFMPAASGLGGNVSVRMDFSSMLGSGMMPLMNTMSGFGEMSSESVQILDSKSFDMMKSVLKMDQAYTNVMKDLKATFIINDGRVFIKPFDTRLGNIRLNISGDQGLDHTINYLIKTEIPRSELGGSAEALMGALSTQAAAFGLALTPPEIIKVNLNVSGTLTAPVIRPVFAGGAGSSMVTAVTDTVRAEVTERVAEAAGQQAEKILAEAEEKAQMLRDEAEKSAKVIRSEADLQGEKLISEAESKGPIALMAARKAAEALNREADKRATQLVTEADKRAVQILAEARAKADELLKQ